MGLQKTRGVRRVFKHTLFTDVEVLLFQGTRHSLINLEKIGLGVEGALGLVC